VYVPKASFKCVAGAMFTSWPICLGRRFNVTALITSLLELKPLARSVTTGARVATIRPKTNAATNGACCILLDDMFATS
jgi:hypothetical protein